MLLVDAYNALHVTGVLPPHLAGLDAPALAELVGRSRWGRGRATLVCDGVKPRGWPREVEGVELRFAGPGRDADGLIERLLRDSPDPRRVTVVSTDQRLRKAAKRAGASSLTSEAFLAQIAADMEAPKARASSPAAGKPEVPLDAFALRRWLDEFGLGSDELSRLAGQAAAVAHQVRQTRAARVETDHAPPVPVRARVPDAEQSGAPPSGSGHLSDSDLQRMLADALKMWPGADLPADLDITRWLATLVDIPARDTPSRRSSRSRR